LKCALVVGGSGMLTDLSIMLAESGYLVYVVGRSSEKMNNLLRKSNDNKNLIPVLIDYSDEQNLSKKIYEIILENNTIQLTVAWVHSYAEHAIQSIINQISATSGSSRFVHVLGSRSNLEKIKSALVIPNHCFYSQVKLGYVKQDNEQRWLTHEEICKGILEAINSKKNIHIVGMLN
jgi:glucuronate isomerase